MSRQNFTLLEFPHTQHEIMKARIEGLHLLLCKGNEAYISDVIQMLIAFLQDNYEGLYVEATVMRLIEAHYWWLECNSPFENQNEVEWE